MHRISWSNTILDGSQTKSPNVDYNEAQQMERKGAVVPSNCHPLVTIITPVFNAAEHLEECLESVQKQTFKDFEHICIDDGSTDESLDILRRFQQKDHRIRIVQQRNSGAASARNNAIEKANGIFLAFLDADDFVASSWLSTLTKKAGETDADIVIHPMTSYDTEDKITRPMPWSCQSDNFPEVFCWKDNPDKILTSFHNWPCNKFFRTDLIKDRHIRFQNVAHTEDFLFTCKALPQQNRIVTVPQALYTYRIGNPSSNLARNDRAPFAFYQAHLAGKAYLEDSGLYDAVRKSFLNWTADGLNLHLSTFASFSTYQLVFEFMQTEGLKALGYDLAKPEDFDSAKLYELIYSILHNTLEEHLFCQYHQSRNDAIAAQRSLEDIIASKSWRVGKTFSNLASRVRRVAHR